MQFYSAVSSESDGKSRGLMFDHGPVPYFRGDWSWNNFYCQSPPSADSRRVDVSYKWKYVHKVLVNHLVKLAHEKSLVWWTGHLDMTITVVWVVKPQTKQNKHTILLYILKQSFTREKWNLAATFMIKLDVT